MRLKYFFLFFVCMFSFVGIALAQTKVVENSGFVPGNLWFSKTPSTVGETVKIYTMVWNGSSDDVSGTVSFFDNDTLIEKQSFILAGAGSSKILSVSWKVGEGYHKIYAQITESSGGARGTKASQVSLEYGKTSEAEQFIGAPTPKGSGATTTAANFVDQKIDYAKGYAENNLPKPVVDVTKATASTTESAREGIKSWSDAQISGLKKSMDLNSKKPVSGGGFDIKGPLSYVELFLLSILSFITGSIWICYGLFVVVTFFILRFIKRKFFF